VLVWRNRKKINQIINGYLYFPFFLLIIIWIRSWLRNEKEAIACALSSGQLFRLPDSAPYFLRQCFLSASTYSTRKIQIVPRIYTLLNDSKDDAACRHAERILAADFTPTGDDVLRMRQVPANSEFFIMFFFYLFQLFTC
jgi:hypothetical protein